MQPNKLISRIARELLKPLSSPGVVVPLGRLLLHPLLTGRAGKDASGKPPLERILVIRLDEIGDMVLTAPFLRELKKGFPGARITLLTTSAGKSLFELCPHVDELLTCDLPRGDDILPTTTLGRVIGFSLKNLRPRAFDIAVVPRFDADEYHAGHFCFLSGAPLRIGYSENATPRKSLKDRGCDRFYTRVLQGGDAMHEVERSLQLLSALGGAVGSDALEAWTSPDDEARAAELLGVGASDGQGDIVAFCPVSRSARRTWPVEGYLQLGTWMNETCGMKIAVIGGQDAHEAGTLLQKELGGAVVNLAGKTTLRQTIAVLRRCRLYVGSDSGPMHLAAAAGTPVIELSCHPKNGNPLHPNSPARFSPWGVRSAVIQPESGTPPCRDACLRKVAHCIRQIRVSQVQDAVSELLGPAKENHAHV